MSYTIEIELPGSGVWFKYFTTVESLEEAESIKKKFTDAGATVEIK